MILLLGFALTAFSLFQGYLLHGGSLSDLWRPNEMLLIFGCMVGAFAVGNAGKLSAMVGTFKRLALSSTRQKSTYAQWTAFVFGFFRAVKTSGELSVETAVEAPATSPLFQAYPALLSDTSSVRFFCDGMRLVLSGVTDPKTLENFLNEDLAHHTADSELLNDALQQSADGLPALGIIAAVLGIVRAMHSLADAPHKIGGMVASALLGTFIGISAGYLIVLPISQWLTHRLEDEKRTMECLKSALLAYAQGFAPSVIAECARRTVPEHLRPAPLDMERVMNAGGRV